MKNKDLLSVQKNKQDALEKLDDYLKDLIVADNKEHMKKADLISYWIKDYTRYLKGEETFVPSMQENYKRGDIVKVNLGFNIGNEEGGLHYAVVVNNPTKSSGIITVVPLTSKKEGTKYHSSTVVLGNTVMENIIKKLGVIENQLLEMQGDLNNIQDIDEKESQRKAIIRTMNELNKYTKEANKLKAKESIALVGNITTISKQRVYTPTINNKFLKGVSISNEQLDLIDNKIIELYTKKRKN